MPPQIYTATTDAEFMACFPVFRHLRANFSDSAADAARFLAQVKRQQAHHGYRILFTRDSERADNPVAACTGFRIAEFLAWGKTLYIDDLICAPEFRGRGHAGTLLDHLIAEARSQKCDQLHLDSGYQRNDAHRLYLNKGLQLSSHHFGLKLT